MLDFTCCDSLVANVPGTRKESGKPGSRAGARSLQQPYFLGAQCTSCPEGFLCNRSTFLLHKKESGEPDSRAGARSLQRPYFLSAECASSRRVFISQDELSCEIKKNLHTGP